ncbi:hypothetical protein HPB47_014018, partial [Ixodes persulcatus]
SLLKRFVDQVLRLYNTKMMTFNMHQLLHLAKSVRDLGPLWAHSAFVFETGNGGMSLKVWKRKETEEDKD